MGVTFSPRRPWLLWLGQLQHWPSLALSSVGVRVCPSCLCHSGVWDRSDQDINSNDNSCHSVGTAAVTGVRGSGALVTSLNPIYQSRSQRVIGARTQQNQKLNPGLASALSFPRHVPLGQFYYFLSFYLFAISCHTPLGNNSEKHLTLK